MITRYAHSVALRAVTLQADRVLRSGGYDQVRVLIEHDDASALVDGGVTMPEPSPWSARWKVLAENGAAECTFPRRGPEHRHSP